MNFLKYIYKSCFALALLAFAAGCGDGNNSAADQPQKASAKKEIISIPAGASIIYNGKELGKTPYVITAKPNSYTIRLSKPGYFDKFYSFSVKSGKNPAETIKLEPCSSSVLVVSQPSKATVIFKGKKIGETPLIIPDLSLGEHSVKLEKSGFSTKDIIFSVTSARPQKISTRLSSSIGSVFIDSSPRGAKITIDGKIVGVTPFNGEFSDGEYKLSLNAPEHIQYDTKLSVQKGRRTRINQRLQLLPGAFEIRTEPAKAKIFWDGKYVGLSPVTIKDQTARVDHSLRITLPGFAEINTKLKTSPGKKEVKSFVLQRNVGDLEFVVNPPGVTVYLDGKKIGVTKKSENATNSQLMTVKNIAPGVHTLYYTHRRAVPAGKSKKIEIKPGSVTRLDPMYLWIPNAEIIYHDDSTESVRIISRNDKGLFVETQDGIKYTILHTKIKTVNNFKTAE